MTNFFKGKARLKSCEHFNYFCLLFWCFVHALVELVFQNEATRDITSVLLFILLKNSSSFFFFFFFLFQLDNNNNNNNNASIIKSQVMKNSSFEFEYIFTGGLLGFISLTLLYLCNVARRV